MASKDSSIINCNGKYLYKLFWCFQTFEYLCTHTERSGWCLSISSTLQLQVKSHCVHEQKDKVFWLLFFKQTWFSEDGEVFPPGSRIIQFKVSALPIWLHYSIFTSITCRLTEVLTRNMKGSFLILHFPVKGESQYSKPATKPATPQWKDARTQIIQVLSGRQ